MSLWIVDRGAPVAAENAAAPLADAVFAPGNTVGTTDVTVSLIEPPAVASTVQIDSFGETASGRAKLISDARITSLTGALDLLVADLLLTEGGVAPSPCLRRGP